MSLPIKLKDVLDALIYTEDDCTTYINKVTGEIATISDEESNYAHEEIDQTSPEWIIAGRVRVKQVLESEDFLEMPSKFDLHEESMMKNFCNTIEKEDVKNYLLKTLGSSSAAENFSQYVEKFDLHKQWITYRDNSIKDIAIKFLQEKSIPYQD